LGKNLQEGEAGVARGHGDWAQQERRRGVRRCLSVFGLALVLVMPSLALSTRAQAAGGTVQAWGYNTFGQLGNGTTSNSSRPGPVSGLSGVVGIASGDIHSLALLSDGTLRAWGDNSNGQLGIGNNTGPESCGGTPCSKTAIPVIGASGVVAMAAGDFHSLALLNNGTVLAWGENSVGQLGDGTTTDRATPVPVSGLSGVVAIAAGGFHSLALLSNGTVMAWGQNNHGELGIGNSTGPETCNITACSKMPVPVTGLSGVVAIAGGFTDAHSLALLSNGTVMAWGQNDELGTGNNTGPETCETEGCSKRPVQVTGLSGVVSIAAGAGTSLARLSNGTAVDWGWNINGALGNGTTTESPIPVPVTGLSSVEALAGGDTHGLALLAGGGAADWGQNAFGELGIGSETGPDDCAGTACSRIPVRVDGLASGTAIAAGFHHNLTLVGASHALSVSLAGAGSGAVGGAGILCPPSCSQPYPQGAPLTLLAQPAASTGFAGFSGACTGTGPCKVTMDGDQEVTATFGPPKGTRITGAKINRRKKTARFRFAAPGAITGFECQLIRPGPRRHHRKHKSARRVERAKPRFAVCGPGMKVYKHLRPGRYTFKVRALDILGADAVPATKRFKIKLAKRGKHKSKH
jgi:alpha-tubulin suppressor-like RCC1 family protein